MPLNDQRMYTGGSASFNEDGGNSPFSQGGSNLGFGGGASNPYLDKSVNDALGDTTRSYNLTTAPAYTSAMVRSGSFGNSGVQEMQNDTQRQLQTTQGRQANDMRSNNYQFGVGTQQNQNQFNDQFNRGVYNDRFGQNQQNFQNGIGLIGMQNQSNQQNLGFGTQMQNAPMNYYQGFSNMANSQGNGYGTDSSTSTARGSPMMGALGGAQMGFNAYNQWNGGTNSMGNRPYSGGDAMTQYGNGVGSYLSGNGGSGG